MYFGGLFCIILKEDMFRKQNSMKSQNFQFSFFFMFSPVVSCLNCWKTADIQAHSAAPSAALRACRSAIFERNCENVCKPLDILTRFYEYPRSAIFEK